MNPLVPGAGATAPDPFVAPLLEYPLLAGLAVALLVVLLATRWPEPVERRPVPSERELRERFGDDD